MSGQGGSIPSSGMAWLWLVAGYAVALLALGLAFAPPAEILDGLIRILTARDALLTDYFGIGGIGASFVNAGLLALLACGLTLRVRARLSGPLLASLFLLMGFGFFGKNLLNIWLILVGVAIYTRIRREPFSRHLPGAFFSCALAPVFTEILFSSSLAPPVRVPLAVVTTVLLGFMVPAASSQLFRAHSGFILYNYGFVAGVVGLIVVALFKSYGFVPDPVMVWTSGPRRILALILFTMLGSMILIGRILDSEAFGKQELILRSTGQAPTDTVAKAGLGPSLVNMGLCGLLGLAYLLLIQADLNGPTLGGVLTLSGFGACGKHPRNIAPILVGVFLGSLAKPWNATDPAVVLAALFGTTLAPIAGAFGWAWGTVAGFVHSSAALSVGSLHAGLNLYNNGFAAGMVAAVLVPVIQLVSGLPGQRRS